MLKADDLLPLPGEDTAQNFRSRSVHPRHARQRLEEEDEEEEEKFLPGIEGLPDDAPVSEDLSELPLDPDEGEAELQHVLKKARKIKLQDQLIKPNLEMLAEDARKAAAVNEEDDRARTGKGHIVLNSTAEFCRSLGDIPTYGLAGNRDEDADELMDLERELLEERRRMEEGGNKGAWNEVEIDETPVEIKNEEAQILDEEPDVGNGIGGALKVAVSKGYLEKEVDKNASSNRMHHLQAQVYSIEDKQYYDDDKFGRGRDRYSGPVVEFKERDNYKPDVKLEYIDDGGRVLNAKEAFRYLSHKFHGKGPGKNKTEKRMKKIQEDTLMKQMSSTDTPVEASTLSPNPILYGDLHNLGHLALGFVHDPDGRYKEPLGVMGDTSTAMRDPVFYRWHRFIDDIFQEHKLMLPPYNEKQLTFPAVKVDSVSVVTKGEVTNTLVTGWQESELELSRGLDFGRDTSIQAKFTHLQHEPFTYKITVINNSQTDRQATVRIFMAPTYNDAGETMHFNEQRLVMIEMDKFMVKMKHGINQLERSSYDSSITIPFEQTFRDLEQEKYVGEPDAEEVNFCGCGWPDHMLVPRGTRTGMEFQLFVMVTNWEDDKVELKNPNALTCRNAASYCGLLDDQYPDRRAMGFPFDRSVDPDKVKSLSDFLTPNMKTQDICVQFTDKVIKKLPSA